MRAVVLGEEEKKKEKKQNLRLVSPHSNKWGNAGEAGACVALGALPASKGTSGCVSLSK